MRVFLLLAAIQCLSEESAVSALVQYDAPYELVRIAPPDLQGMKKKRAGDVALYWRQRTTEVPEIATLRSLEVVAERAGQWFELRDEEAGLLLQERGPTRPETLQPPIIEQAGPGIIRITWIGQFTAQRSGLTRQTVLLDFRARPRVLLSIDCTDSGGGGACTAPDLAHFASHELACDDDLRCTMRETVFLDWTTRAATRRFDLLTNETLPPSRFDAVRYANGAAFAAAGPDALRQRALIDGIGIVQPVYEVSPGRVLFAAHAREPVAAFRFFLLDHGRWREIPRTLITDARYPGGEDDLRERASTLSPGFTAGAPQLVFHATRIDIPGRNALIEVVGTEGSARSLHWILLGANGRNGALRLATNEPEWRHCGNVVHPISVSSLQFSETAFPVIATAVASWRADDHASGTMPRTCSVSGTIDWDARKGWIVRLGQEPCTDPVPRPYVVRISEEGRLFSEPVKFSQ